MKISLSPFPTLTTDRLVLRPLNISDSEDLMHIRSNEQVNKYLGRPMCKSIDEAANFIRMIHRIIQNNEGVYWVISLKEHARLIGTICYWNIIPEKCMAEIGYELLPCQHGKGLMQEAVNKVISYGFDSMELKVITALPHPANAPSVKLLKRSGFELDAQHQYVCEQEAGEQDAYVLLNK